MPSPAAPPAPALVVPGLAQSAIDELKHAVETQPVVLYGWSQCPCTNIARTRFQELGVCFVENVWAWLATRASTHASHASPRPGALAGCTDRVRVWHTCTHPPTSHGTTPFAPAHPSQADFGDKTMKYLACEHGDEHHSFIWFGGDFYGDGFALEERKLGEPATPRCLSCRQLAPPPSNSLPTRWPLAHRKSGAASKAGRCGRAVHLPEQHVHWRVGRVDPSSHEAAPRRLCGRRPPPAHGSSPRPPVGFFPAPPQCQQLAVNPMKREPSP